MAGIQSLIDMARDRLNLTHRYTPWEAQFLRSVITAYDRYGSLKPAQEKKLKEIVLVRYIQGEPPHIDATGKRTGQPFPIDRVRRTHDTTPRPH